MIKNVGSRLSSWLSAKSVISIEENHLPSDENFEIKCPKQNVFVEFLTNEFKNVIEDINKSDSTKNKRFKWFNMLIIAAMWVLCIIAVFNGVKDYLKFDVVSQTRILEEIPSLFPTVTICNLNTFSTEKASKIALSIIKRELNEDLSQINNISYSDYLSYIEIAHAISLSEVSNPDYGDENRKALGFSLDNILGKCLFNKKSCNQSDFEWYFDFNHGNCFKFNSGYNSSGHKIPLKYSQIPGENNGLFLSFFLRSSKNKYSASSSNGLRIFVHNASFSPSSSEGINVKSATLTNIAIKRTIMNKAPSPYSDCINLSFNKVYRQSDCFKLCLQNNIIENCECYYLEYPKSNNATPCLNTTQLLCASNQYINFIGTNIKKLCSQFCPLECDTVVYDLYLSSSDYPSQNLYQIMKRDKKFIKKYFNSSHFTYNSVKEKSVAINIFYPHLKYTYITELEKTTLSDLMSGIGGTLGLFLGISILNLIKIAEQIIENIILLLNTLKLKIFFKK